MISYGLDLNLVPGGVLPRLDLSQYNKGQVVSVALWDGDTAYSMASGATATVQGTKPDGTGFQYSCTVVNNQPQFTVTEQMTAVAGEVNTEITIMEGDTKVSTINFILDVEKAALSDNTVISETDIPIIQQLPEIQAEIEAAKTLAEMWAAGPNPPADTPSATNNAYYWAMQAASAAGGGLRPQVVEELPTTGISTSIIYFVPTAEPSASNIYDEYINIDGTSSGWELIGTTAIDMTDYYTKGEVDALLSTTNSNVTTLDTQLKACSGNAEEFDSTRNYVPTNMVYHNGDLYQCIGAYTGDWDDLYFEPVDLSLLQTRYTALNADLTQISTHLTDLIITRELSLTVPIQGLTYYEMNFNFDTVQGYHPIGIVGESIAVLGFYTSRLQRISNTVGAVTLNSVSGTAANNVVVKIQVLYMKN